MESDYRRTNIFPLAQLAAGLAIGILLGRSTSTFFVVVVGAALLCTAGALTFLVLSRLRLAAVSLFLAFTFCGATVGHLELRTASPDRVKQLFEDRGIGSGKPVEVTGVLTRNPEISWESVHLTLRVERIKVHGSENAASGVVTLITPLPADRTELEELELRYGARIRVITRLERANNFRNPGVSSYAEYLDRKGHDASGFIKSPLLIERLEDERVFLPLALVYDWRTNLQQQFDSQFAKDTASVLDAALLGNRYNLSYSTEERFREGGTFHVLVISGLHITFLGGVIFVISRRLTRNRTTQYAASVTIIWVYSVAVGAEPSILRAALMFSVVMLAPLVSRRASALNGLGAVALVLLIWKPSNLLDPSFQLTFISVLAILVLAWPLLQTLAAVGLWRPARATPYPPSCPLWLRRLSETLFWNQRNADREIQRASYNYTLSKSSAASTLQRFYLQQPLRFAFAALVVSISVQIALLPFLIVYFHRFSLASLVLNIFVSVVMGALALTALAGVALAQVSSVMSMPFTVAADILNSLMVHSVDPFTRVQLASTRLPEYTGWPATLYAAYYIPLATLAICLAKWKPLELPKTKDAIRSRRIVWLALGVQLLAITVLIVHPFSAIGSEGKLRIDFLDVGQGDAALLTLPDNTTILIDGGGRPGPFPRATNGNDELGEPEREHRGVGESVVSEYLWWSGLDRVDYLIATHADADHIDGLNDISRNFDVRAVLAARSPTEDAEFGKLAQTLASRKVPVRIVGSGDELRVGEVSLQVLWPTPSGDTQLPSRNDDSMVLQLRFGKRSVLLTGDIEARAETALVRHYKSSLKSDLIKVAHHGSKTSSTESFVRAVGSRFSVVSVGESSMFGHPHPEVVERWKSIGAEVLTTGKSGMITLITDGENVELKTFVKPKPF